MKNYEKEIYVAWKKLKEKTEMEVTLKDIEEITEVFAKTFNKIQSQREELEMSRDNWKSKYLELKQRKLK